MLIIPFVELVSWEWEHKGLVENTVGPNTNCDCGAPHLETVAICIPRTTPPCPKEATQKNA